MRRAAAWAMALTLCIGGMAACGDDGGGDDDAGGSTTTTAPTMGPTTGSTPGSTTGATADLTAAVDEFCAKTDEVQQLYASFQSSPDDPPTPEEEKQVTDLAGEALPLMLDLQSKQAQMVPGDAARFQECAAVFGGGVEAPPG